MTGDRYVSYPYVWIINVPARLFDFGFAGGGYTSYLSTASPLRARTMREQALPSP